MSLFFIKLSHFLSTLDPLRIEAIVQSIVFSFLQSADDMERIVTNKVAW